MTTTRQITALLTRHLGADCAPWAARLVREGMLPRHGEPIDEREAAALLLAIFAASDPDRAVDALNTLAKAPLHQVHQGIANTALGIESWRRMPKGTFGPVAASALDVVVEAIQGGISINWLSIDDGGDVASFEIVVATEPPSVYRLNYLLPTTHKIETFMRLAQASGAVVGVLADALRPEEQRARTAPLSLELH